MWLYNDIYRAIVFYINQDLRETDYTLNFGVVGISTQTPWAIVQFCLRNMQTNRQRWWKAIVVRETLRELENSVHMSMREQLESARKSIREGGKSDRLRRRLIGVRPVGTSVYIQRTRVLYVIVQGNICQVWDKNGENLSSLSWGVKINEQHSVNNQEVCHD